MQVDQKVDYIEFPCADFDAVQSFYEKAFGWEFTDYGPEYRSFTDGKIDGGFRRADLHSSTDNGSAIVILYAEDLEATLRHIGATRYHNLHPFHRLLHGGKLDKGQVQAWALNRYYYQSTIPLKDAMVISRFRDRATRLDTPNARAPAIEFECPVDIGSHGIGRVGPAIL